MSSEPKAVPKTGLGWAEGAAMVMEIQDPRSNVKQSIVK